MSTLDDDDDAMVLFDFDDDGINKTIIFIKNIDNFKSHFRKDKIDKLLNG